LASQEVRSKEMVRDLSKPVGVASRAVDHDRKSADSQSGSVTDIYVKRPGDGKRICQRTYENALAARFIKRVTLFVPSFMLESNELTKRTGFSAIHSHAVYCDRTIYQSS